MTTLLNLEYDLRPELTAYRRLLAQLFDAQADLRRTEFLRVARRTRVHHARADPLKRMKDEGGRMKIFLPFILHPSSFILPKPGSTWLPWPLASRRPPPSWNRPKPRPTRRPSTWPP